MRLAASFACLVFAVSAAGVGLTGAGAQALQYYLNQVVGLTPLVAGTGILISLVFDAVFDPVVAWWSDNTRSRLGQRIAWIIRLYGAERNEDEGPRTTPTVSFRRHG